MHGGKEEVEDFKNAKVQNTVSRQIESIIAASFTALNSRNFDLATPPWTCYSKHFRNEPNGPAPNLSTYSDHPNLSNSEVTDLAGMIGFFRTLYETCPEYKTLVVDMTTTELDLEAGYAAVMVNAESHGIPQGLLRSSISTFEFRREKREWRCVRNRTLPGIAYVPEV